MTAWWYWALFALAVLLVASPYLLYRWEARQNRRDRELWARYHGNVARRARR